jgi:TolB protein
VELFQPAAWSPDGRRLAFTARSAGSFASKTDVFVMRANGSGRRRVTTDGRSSHPLWSPDGARIYFARSGPPGNLGEEGRIARPAAIWSMRPDGSDPRRVTSLVDGRYDIPGSFSPDGSTLAFTRGVHVAPGADGRVLNAREVWVIRPDGSEASRLADRSQDPAFSPDGRSIAFVSDRAENGELAYGDRAFFANELYVMAADGSRPRRLSRTRARNERQPSWLPNGRRIAYQRGRTYQNAEATVVMQANADGSCAKRVFADPGADRWPWYAAPTWRPGNARAGDGALSC